MKCEIHRRHNWDSSPPLTDEDHHVIPQAWQHLALTSNLSEAQQIVNARLTISSGFSKSIRLFDKRTVSLAPSCHRNVHFYIVALMKNVEIALGAGQIQGVEPELVEEMEFRTRIDFHLRANSRHNPEIECASLALSRWIEAGYNLTPLIEAGLFGEA